MEVGTITGVINDMGDLPYEKWLHIAVTYDQSSNLFILYWDGQEVARGVDQASSPQTPRLVGSGRPARQSGGSVEGTGGPASGIRYCERPMVRCPHLQWCPTQAVSGWDRGLQKTETVWC